MYNEKLEALITAALADGVLKDKKKERLFKKAEALGIDRNEFELVLDDRLAKRKKEMGDQAPKSTQKESITCPYCGSSVPELTDKCPKCGGNITPEASEVLEEIFEHLETALVRFKAGEDVEKSKAEVECYVRKAKVYYENNPRIQYLLEEIEKESKMVKKEVSKDTWMSCLTKNMKTIATAIVLLVSIYVGWYLITYHARQREKDHQEFMERREKELEIVKNTAKQVNEFLVNGEVDKAADALTMCTVSNLGDSYGERYDTTSSLYKVLISKVVDAYLEKGQKGKAQNLVVLCSTKFNSQSMLRDLFKKLGSDDNYEFN